MTETSRVIVSTANQSVGHAIGNKLNDQHSGPMR